MNPKPEALFLCFVTKHDDDHGDYQAMALGVDTWRARAKSRLQAATMQPFCSQKIGFVSGIKLKFKSNIKIESQRARQRREERGREEESTKERVRVARRERRMRVRARLSEM